MATEPRQSQRVNAEVSVRLQNNASGITRDISPSGVYFVIDETVADGQPIRFTLEFEDPAGGVLHLNCSGHVVRVEESGGKRGVAVRIAESSLERRPPGTVLDAHLVAYERPAVSS
jgi:hypothetical protein